VHTYEAGLGWDLPNLLSSIGSFVMAAGIATVLCDLVIHFRYGRRAGANPWRADTLEWATATPPGPYNFASLPVVTSRHPLWDQPGLGEELARGGGGLALIDHGRRETWGTAPASGAVREIIHLPGNSWMPFIAAVLLAGVCIGLLLRAYPAAALIALSAAAVLLRWSWENGAHILAAHPLQRAAGEPPLHSHTIDGPGLWGMRFALVADGAFYLALLFGWWSLSMRAPGPPPAPAGGAGGWLLLAAVTMTVAAGGLQVLLVRLRRRKEGGLEAGLAALAAVGVLHCILVVAALPALAPAPTVRARDAVSAVLLAYSLVHGALAAVLAALQALRARLGYVGVAAPYEPRVMSLLWHYGAAVLWCSYFALVVFAPT
jgi:cytochrome c oxidase subunit I+III